MKRLFLVVSVLVLCVIVMSSGCTGIPGSPAAPPATPPAPAAEPAGMAGTTWSGTYMTTWQGGGHDIRMVLAQSGSSVTGTYEYNDGTITGTVEGGRLTGVWTEDKGESSGPFMFELAPDGKTFAGWWAYEGDNAGTPSEGTSDWTGIRVS